MRKIIFLIILSISGINGFAQQKGLVETFESPFAKLYSVDIDKVAWTKGFWAERFDVCKDTMLYNMWRIFDDPQLSHAYRNFEIAAGYEKGEHKDPAFYDGDMYKWFEGCCSVYAITKDAGLKILMDKFVRTILDCQRADGYIHTQTLIRDRNNPGRHTEFEERLHFETYNFGHLMTAACVHYRATGEKNLLNAAIKATDYLYRYYKRAPEELAQNAICPSHYMGVVEMYRTTHDPKYLELAKGLIDIRSKVVNGTDDNQDRVPFRKQMKAMGHAVRSNYLYAGVTDLYMETGEDSLLNCLNSIWEDVTKSKMYVTGACGALYDGTSPDATCYTPDSIQKIHQAYGRSYQLPNITAHNETCANIGNVLWNRRMLQISGEEKYAGIMELALYNSVLSGISLDGKKFFYTNPLAASDDFPYTLRWSEGKYKERQPYISCFCCPPNTVRAIAEVQQYAYCLSQKGIYVNLYGSNTIGTILQNGETVRLSQTTDYPWDGDVKITIDKAGKKPFSIFMRIPGWCEEARLFVNGRLIQTDLKPESYYEINRKWSKDDIVELDMPMKVRFLESNPLVEESRNQVAVMRGPLVYCIESTDLPEGLKIRDILIPLSASFKPVETAISGSRILMLEGEVKALKNNDWTNKLYKEANQALETVKIRLVPYYAWANRGHSEMSVWIPSIND
jgi:uncharacterized protein